MEVNTALSKLKEWFAGEAVNQLGEALNSIEGHIGEASSEVVNGFGEMQKWVSEDVIVTITNTLGAVTHKVSSASDAIMEEVANLREMFSKRVVQNTFDMLSGIEDRLWESEATMKAFWDRAMSYTSRFTEVWFVQGANAMIAEISQISLRAKSKIFISAPRFEDINFVPLKPLPDKIAIRICCAIDPKNPKDLEIIKQYINKQNYQFRHYG